MFWRNWLNGWFKKKKNLRCSWILAWLLLGLVQGHIFRPFPDLQWGGGCRWWHVPRSNFGLKVLSGAFYIFSWKKRDFHDTLRDLWGFVKYRILRLHQMTCFPFYTRIMDFSGFFKTKEHFIHGSQTTQEATASGFGGLQPQTNGKMFWSSPTYLLLH